jgi:His/Glu/Gln/Arg/opine family amino acid ABC transporter permease subunit
MNQRMMKQPMISRRAWARAAFWLIVLLGGAWLVRGGRWDVVRRASPFLLKGLALSWELSILSVLIGLAAGIVLAAGRLYGFPGLRHLATAYIELVRSVPQIMIIFWVFFGAAPLTGHALDAWLAALIALSLIASAYLAEVVRAGLLSVPKVHRESAYSAGLAPATIFLHIVLPQAMRNMLPALIAHIIMIFKVTSLVYLIGLVDFFRATMLVNNRDYAPGPLYLTMAIVYFLCNFGLSKLLRRFDPKYALSS